MNQEITDPKNMLQTVLAQEEALQFDRFTAEDGWQLGLLLREHLLRHGGNAAADATAYGVQCFRCTAGTATPNNTRWVRRKSAVVMENWKSSLRVMLEMHLSGRTLAEFGLDAEEYALSGGCFPIRLRGQGVVGTVTVSGLPQTHDHQTAVDAVAAYLGVEVPSILA
jgi:uncharacterized protein (UPF0303 family)